jgi:hypothetical protein
MDAGLVRKGLVAALSALAASALGLAARGPAPAVAEAAALEPDLVTMRIDPEDLVVVEEKGRTVLRMTTEVANRGLGPLEVFPSQTSADCDGNGDFDNDRTTFQRTFADTNGSGAFEPEADGVHSEREFGCMKLHVAHGHWHVLDFARYELRREPRGRLVAISRKVGFCLTDYRLAYPGPGAPLSPRYPIDSGLQSGCDQQATQGISVGWVDSYPFALPGQELDVTGLRRGRYCLSMTADPLDRLSESDARGNERRARIALRPRRQSVRRLKGACRSPRSGERVGG